MLTFIQVHTAATGTSNIYAENLNFRHLLKGIQQKGVPYIEFNYTITVYTETI